MLDKKMLSDEVSEQAIYHSKLRFFVFPARLKQSSMLVLAIRQS
jgi:hypothetical protein